MANGQTPEEGRSVRTESQETPGESSKEDSELFNMLNQLLNKKIMQNKDYLN